MKVAHKNKAIDRVVEHKAEQSLSIAKTAEQEDTIDDAIDNYEKVIKEDPLNEYAYDRLMILYRKNKEYKKELKIINTAVTAYAAFYKKGKAKRTGSVATISEKINKAFGLVDKKGNELYEPEPIARWKKRKAVVEKKIK
jgi:tetratricopeptide (TPR) repeat protein